MFTRFGRVLKGIANSKRIYFLGVQGGVRPDRYSCSLVFALQIHRFHIKHSKIRIILVFLVWFLQRSHCEGAPRKTCPVFQSELFLGDH